MSKLERLNARVSKLLTVAVHEVLEVVRDTVSEYQEKTARTQRENERLRLKLRDALDLLEKEREGECWPSLVNMELMSWSSMLLIKVHQTFSIITKTLFGEMHHFGL